ncbi:MAG: DUF790 family protein [Armatimonadota bacterium]|nr:DUF790 family protein [Armatimonadota bacterium]
MLTRQHRIYHWIRPGRAISSDRLEPDCLPHLVRAIAVYRRLVGRPRAQVREAARHALAALRPDRVEALVKLLEDAATYDWPRGPEAAARRLRLFEAAAREHPVLDAARAAALVADVAQDWADGGDVRSRSGVPAPTGARASSSPRTLVSLLYADYPEFHRLRAFPPDYTPEDLRDDYALAQAQALLYDAVRVTVEATDAFGHVVRAVRLARLIHQIERLPAGYRLVLDGPASVLRHTHAYGVDFAKFLAALVAVSGWTLTAEITLRKGWRPVLFALSDAHGLRSRVSPPALFDSRLEERFARKFGAARDGWRLVREGAILAAGEALLVPDFLFRHEDGTEVALEIVGYWTPEYLEYKFQKLSRVRGVNLLVAVRPQLAARAGTLPATVLSFRSGILLRDLLPRLEAFRQQGSRAGLAQGRAGDPVG